MRMFLLAALGGALLSAPAAAQPSLYASRTVNVNYGDLDLSTEAGRARLDRRLGSAARKACRTGSSADLLGRHELERCLAETLASLAPKRDRIVRRAQGTQIAAK